MSNVNGTLLVLCGVLLGLLFGRVLPIESSFAEDSEKEVAPIAPSHSISAIPHDGPGNGRVWQLKHSNGSIRVCQHDGSFSANSLPDCSGWYR